ncbi:MAG: MerR family transcriptional regulator [Bacteroidales bacterium]|nr:MerR family transcriptional regulator [Bacteroidales bacterium]
MEKLYYTIGEVADKLGESVSLVRFWSDSFPKYVRPARNAKGNRLYSDEDVEALQQVHYLVRDCGLTLEGAAKRLQSDRLAVEKKTKVLTSLKAIKAQLTEIRKSL